MVKIPVCKYLKYRVFYATVGFDTDAAANPVSAILLRHAAGGVFALSLSQDIVTETETVLLEREHIRRRYPYSNDDVMAFCQTLQRSFPFLALI